MRDKSKFRMIADQFRYMIRSGELVSGEKFHTRKELCSLYNISSMTAFHVQEELQKDGLITNVPDQSDGQAGKKDQDDRFSASHRQGG